MTKPTTSTATMKPITPNTDNHYRWGEDHACDGWRLLHQPNLSVIKERVPAGCKEQMHVHQQAEQLFYVLNGEAVMVFEDRRIRMLADTALHVPAGVPHQLVNASDQDVWFLVISSANTQGDRQNMDKPS